ncbi:NAD(P)/FAD-dependent oxidoreductase [Streptomyces sp. NPDC050560]|uniref:NAD(P)/FAD-dependent oxidoreductase n=1 Tax=Streptomyces sp. NPDC050560 TaxID=3365630 RepID=UPI00379AE1C9
MATEPHRAPPRAAAAPGPVVIVGAGLAGCRVAARTGGVLIGDEAHAPYNRVLLAEVLAGRYGPGVIALPPHPGTLLHTRATRVDRATRTVHCADGSEVGYGTLVLATGSDPVLPPLRGLPGDRALPSGVHAFRTLDDCLALSAAVRPCAAAVVVGGGLLGVSAARALARRGARVVLAQQAGRLLERQLDPRAAALVRRHLTGLGVQVRTECRVRGARVRGGAVRGVELADGHVLDCELLVLACGVRPRTSLAAAAGLAVRRGVVVDAELRTSDPDVRAVGDCAEHDGVVYGLAAPALDQADTLADALAPPHRAARYRGTRSLTRLTLPGHGAPCGPLDVAAFGEVEPRPGDDVVQLSDATRGVHRRVLVRGDRLVGGVLIGDLDTVGALARAWEDGVLADAPLLHLLTHDGGR